MTTEKRHDVSSDDELLARLRAADPTADGDGRSHHLAESWIDELAEATMRQTLEADRLVDSSGRRRTWTWASAAAALVVGAAAVGIATGGPDTPIPHVAATQKVMVLGLPASDAAASCLQFSVEVLRPMEVAFSGTATEVGSRSVTLSPDHWYKGGDGSNVVRLDTLAESVALLGGITFETGKRYLITATDGQVNACGFSSEWNPQMEAAFAEAFGG